DRCADGTAVAAFEEPQRTTQPRNSADAGERVQRDAPHNSEYLRCGSAVPDWLRAKLESFAPTRSARLITSDGNLQRLERNAPDAGVPAEHVSNGRGKSVSNLSNRLPVPGFEWECHTPLRASPVKTASAKWPDGQHSIH